VRIAIDTQRLLGEMENLKYIDDLDWKLRLSLRPDTDITEVSRKFNIRSEAGLYLGDKGAEMNLFFKIDGETNRDLSIFLNKFGALEKNGIWRIKQTVKMATKFMDMIGDILDLPSTYLESVWLSNGTYKFEMLYHHSDMAKVFGLLSDQLQNTPESKIDYIGPNNGFDQTLNAINSETKLTIVQLELSIPESVEKTNPNPVGVDWFRIHKIPFGSEKIKVIYFVNEIPKNLENLEEIEKGRIYAGTLDNPLIDIMHTKINEMLILPISRFNVLKNGKITFWLIVPSMFDQELLDLFHETGLTTPMWKPEIKRFQPYGDWVKDVEW
jgi:hypothetical protein